MKYLPKLLLILTVIVLSLAVLAGCNSADYLQDISRSADNYKIVMGYDETNHILTALQDIELTNHMDTAQNSIKLHLYASAYREETKNNIVANSYLNVAYPNGKSYGDITVNKTMIDGADCSYVIEGDDQNILSVQLTTPLQPNEKITLSIDYTITLANIHHRLGYGEDTVNLANFYPIICHDDGHNYITSSYIAMGDPFVSRMANYDVTITANSNYKLASTGDLVSATANGDTTTYHYKANAVRDYAIVMSDKFATKTFTLGDTMINYYYYADSQPDVTLASIIAAVKFLNENVGQYPYKQLSVAESNFCYGGMEYPNMVMVSSGLSEYTTAVIHEVTHQWFYGVVGSDQIEHPWLDEALTEFVTMLIMDNAEIRWMDNNISQYYKAYTTYVDVLSSFYGKVDTSMRPLTQFGSEQDYVYITYIKGCIMFYNAYDTMGHHKFIKALSIYYNNYRGTIATPSDLISSFNKAFGADMTEFFDSYINGEELLYNNGNSDTTNTEMSSVMA